VSSHFDELTSSFRFAGELMSPGICLDERVVYPYAGDMEENEKPAPVIWLLPTSTPELLEEAAAALR
jgi:hypothetical protein